VSCLVSSRKTQEGVLTPNYSAFMYTRLFWNYKYLHTYIPDFFSNWMISFSSKRKLLSLLSSQIIVLFVFKIISWCKYNKIGATQLYPYKPSKTNLKKKTFFGLYRLWWSIFGCRIQVLSMNHAKLNVKMNNLPSYPSKRWLCTSTMTSFKDTALHNHISEGVRTFLDIWIIFYENKNKLLHWY